MFRVLGMALVGVVVGLLVGTGVYHSAAPRAEPAPGGWLGYPTITDIARGKSVQPMLEQHIVAPLSQSLALILCGGVGAVVGAIAGATQAIVGALEGARETSHAARPTADSRDERVKEKP